MIEFNAANGNTYRIYFKHHSSGQGQMPEQTTCTIKLVRGDAIITVGSGYSRPVKEVATIIPEDLLPSEIQTYYGKNFKKSYKTAEGIRMAVLSGDVFSKQKGRAISLKKALNKADFSKESRRRAWEAYWSSLEQEDAVKAV